MLKFIADRRQTPADILKALSHPPVFPKTSVQDAIRELVAAGALTYTTEYGRSFLEPSFDRPVRVSERIVLAPPDRDVPPGLGDIVVRLRSGAAFGVGRHPTTRLALRGIEFALSRSGAARTRAGSSVLDIGTGSGVLAIAAVKLGIENGVGLDIDPCAVTEAAQNVSLNGLAGRIEISDRGLDRIEGVFSLVVANLRLPTLERLARAIAALTMPGGALVVSGVQYAEQAAVVAIYGRQRFECAWSVAEDRWMGLVLNKTG
ncbi:MAG: 50S ribosomal protein L11 methyltransferase [Deltaproteobacteria bacterium]|nr:50S ribosomal protein L11 methyltransferase [Deltaproteobacteria bacterium]